MPLKLKRLLGKRSAPGGEIWRDAWEIHGRCMGDIAAPREAQRAWLALALALGFGLGLGLGLGLGFKVRV